MKVRDITFISLFAAVMGVLGLVPPIVLTFSPVPIVLQNFGVMLAGGLLGARLGAWSQAIFLMVVAAGMPLLSGGRGGLSVFVGPSAGYLFGYIIVAFTIGYILSRFRVVTFIKILITNLLAGVFLLYVFGVPVQAFVMNISLAQALISSWVYLPGDLLKAILAAYLVNRLRKSPVFQKKAASI
ncbi:biotin transporter BioY [Bacillus gobiensis]|uniref:biotin transporter BioY n=1 Tax=Bacillus gobiensis TaxID=1441095 RepID=UPI003D22F22B